MDMVTYCSGVINQSENKYKSCKSTFPVKEEKKGKKLGCVWIGLKLKCAFEFHLFFFFFFHAFQAKFCYCSFTVAITIHKQ